MTNDMNVTKFLDIIKEIKSVYSDESLSKRKQDKK